MKNKFIHKTSFIDPTSEIGEGTKVWQFCNIMHNVKIGKNCVIGQNVMIGPNVVIGNNCKIQNNVSLYDGVELHDFVFLGPSCVFTNVINPRAGIERKDQFMKTVIRDGASIGANATIVCGNTIEEYAMVGAGSVVTKDVKNNQIVIGNPAKHYAWVSDYGEVLDDSMICRSSKESYFIKNDRIYKKN